MQEDDGNVGNLGEDESKQGTFDDSESGQEIPSDEDAKEAKLAKQLFDDKPEQSYKNEKTPRKRDNVVFDIILLFLILLAIAALYLILKYVYGL